jgi:hypothetical protein
MIWVIFWCPEEGMAPPTGTIDNTDFLLPNLGRHYGRARWTDVRGNLDVIQLHIRTSVLGGDRCQKEGTFDLTHSVTGVRL